MFAGLIVCAKTIVGVFDDPIEKGIYLDRRLALGIQLWSASAVVYCVRKSNKLVQNRSGNGDTAVGEGTSRFFPDLTLRWNCIQDHISDLTGHGREI